MSARKRETSKRNSHTGVINSIKQMVLDRGQTQRSSDGTLYCRAEYIDKVNGVETRKLSPIVKVPVL